MYLVRLPKWAQYIYPKRVFSFPSKGEKVLYITFDDGPNESTTPFILDTLQNYNAQATFFCIGQNVERLPELYDAIIKAGHIVGNHTAHHLNGWNTSIETYIEDIEQATEKINSILFRPPYGRMTKAQEKVLQAKYPALKTVMWTILSGDFDTKINGEKCTQNVISKARNGDIIVFHDSNKAKERLEVALPKVLDFFSKKGFVFKTIPTDFI